MAKLLIGLGICLILVGMIIYLGGDWLPLGRLPGDIHWTKGNTTFYFPLMSSIIISIVLTIVIQFLFRR